MTVLNKFVSWWRLQQAKQRLWENGICPVCMTNTAYENGLSIGVPVIQYCPNCRTSPQEQERKKLQDAVDLVRETIDRRKQ